MEHGVQGNLKTRKQKGSLTLSFILAVAKRGANCKMQTADRRRDEGVAQDRKGFCRTIGNFANVGVNK